MRFDKIIIGAGMYGLYSALYCAKKGESVLIIEKEKSAFNRATYINQARVHKGYHYPRSITTAAKSAAYFDRFNEDYGFCINKKFEKIYATSDKFSWTDGPRFNKFCNAVKIPCTKIEPTEIFKKDMVDGAFITEEYTYDAKILNEYFLNELEKFDNVKILYGTIIKEIMKKDDAYSLLTLKQEYTTNFLLNCTYASINQILDMLNYEKFNIKYELCEIILCRVNDKLKDRGITVMDGPFFSIMPFGKTGYHSLTSVTFTPHIACFDDLPNFPCQEFSDGYCDSKNLGNCNECKAKPISAWIYMSNLAKKYLRDDYHFEYIDSLYSIKPILKSSEIDDSRPTVIKKFSSNPYFYSVLSGKINTIYDLEEIL